MTIPGMAITELQELVRPLEIPDTTVAGEQVEEWLGEVGQHIPSADGEVQRWLLAHVYAGVVWGREDVGGWHLSADLGDEFPNLDIDALLECRIFNEKGEVFVWRDGDDLHGRAIIENDFVDVLSQNKNQILWGTKGVPIGNNQFTRMTDGDQKLLHAVPLEVPQEAQDPYWRPLSLQVRNYIGRDEETGLARVVLSRLVQLRVHRLNEREDRNGSQA